MKCVFLNHLNNLHIYSIPNIEEMVPHIEISVRKK